MSPFVTNTPETHGKQFVDMETSADHDDCASASSVSIAGCNLFSYTNDWSPKNAVTSSGAELPAAINVAPATSWVNPRPEREHKETSRTHNIWHAAFKVIEKDNDAR